MILLPSMQTAPDKARKKLEPPEENTLLLYSFFWSLMLLAAVPAACAITGEWHTLIPDLLRIWLSPSKLVTDYFELGNLPSTFLNAGLCGLSCSLLMWLLKAKPSATLLAAYFLVIAHCFYGLNFVNMWLPMFGIAVYCKVEKLQLKDCLNLAMFATSLGPFISDFFFRYTCRDTFDQNNPQISLAGVLIAVFFSLIAGFAIPALLPGTTEMHKGFNLYKAGLAIGIMGIFAYALFYKTVGIDSPEVIRRTNQLYENMDRSHAFFINLFFGLVFAASIFAGWLLNGKSLKGYKHVLAIDGHSDNLPLMFGVPLTLINIGIYGLCVLAYMNINILVFPGVGFTGPTTGVIIAAITFSAAGQTPRNVWPIAAGYILLFAVVNAIAYLAGLPLSFSLSEQGYINGLAFATGLCPFTGRYGKKVGMLAGALDAILCTSTSAMHGGFMLYNGGLTAGLTAILLIPILGFYHVKEKPLNPWE